MLNARLHNTLTLGAVLGVMVMIAGVYLYYQQRAEQLSLQREGVALARLLASFHWQVDEESNAGNVERLFEYQLSSRRFAYGLVVDADGTQLSDPVTRYAIGALPGWDTASLHGWLNERELALEVGPVKEFYGPIKGYDSNHPVYFRIGYWQPTLGLSAVDVPALATLILPVFLLLPIWWFVQQRARRPIQEISEKLAAITEGQSMQRVEVHADGELKALLTGFNNFISNANQRIQSAESTSNKLVTQERFLTYRAERYESILQTLPDGVLIVDEDFKVAFINQHVEYMFGVERLDVVSTTVDTWCSYEPLLEYLRELKRDPQKAMAGVWQMSDPKSPSRTVGMTAHPLYFARSSGENSGLLVLIRDVSQEIAAKRSRAEFVGSVSHEVKAPLNTIGLYAQMLEENGSDPDFLIDAQNTITQEVERMTRLIHNLLSMTQIEMGTFELDAQRVYLTEVVADCVGMLDHGPDQARIQVVGGDKLPAVNVDKELLRIAISNLMTNGLKYSGDDRPVTVTMEETPEAIVLSVEDQGAGISEEDQERIFDKFYRSDSEATQSKAGHGLGLSIAREIIGLHHGSLSVQSRLGEGSTFTIELWKRSGSVKQAI